MTSNWFDFIREILNFNRRHKPVKMIFQQQFQIIIHV